ncbi:peptide chain release factor 1 [Candidatus Saganbacteria bacterium]|nr:peptide chain release factor 1 [Candidatus Saganbacteria bacterium]
MIKKLENIEKRYLELEKLLSAPEIINDREKFQAYSKELGDLREFYAKIKDYKSVLNELTEAKSLLQDQEMKELAKTEIDRLEPLKEKLKKELEVFLLPQDPLDDRNIIIEIRAGAGGEEAALFAGELLRMYLRYAERRGWQTEIISSSPTGLGGYKEVIFNVIGQGAYSRLKYEGGAHRVQRVPATEASGRIHTSAVTVAVLPEAEEVDVKIDEKDLRIDTYRAGGPGGQNVNKVSSAIRITHLPTGLVVACQEERSQLQNRAKAMTLLRSRLLENAQEEERKKRITARRIMVGTGDRSEKIRTYNFPQSRITDHRIGFTTHRFNDVLDGELDEIIEALRAADQAAKLAKAD